VLMYFGYDFACVVLYKDTVLNLYHKKEEIPGSITEV